MSEPSPKKLAVDTSRCGPQPERTSDAAVAEGWRWSATSRWSSPSLPACSNGDSMNKLDIGSDVQAPSAGRFSDVGGDKEDSGQDGKY